MKKNRPAPPPILPAPPAGELRARLVWAAALFAALLAVYGFSHDKVYYFDGLLQAGVVESDLGRTETTVVFEWNHFLWYPTLKAFYSTVRALGWNRRGYEILQTFNTIVGAAGIALLFLILTRRVGRPWALAWSLFAAFCEVYWYRSGGAENHLFGTFWLIGFCWFLWSYRLKPSLGNLSAMAGCSALATYYHLGNFFVWGALALAVLALNGKKWGRMLGHGLWAGAILAAMWTVYGRVHHWFEPGGFSRWWTWSTALAHGNPAGGGTGGISLRLLENLPVALVTLTKSFLYYETFTAWTALRLSAILLAGAAGIYLGRRGPPSEVRPEDWRKDPGLVFLLPLLSFGVLYALWIPGNYRYWVMHPVFIVLVAGNLSFRRQPPKPRRAQWACFALMIGLLAQGNWSSLIKPQRTHPRQFIVDAAVEIGRLTPPGSPIIISGSEWNDLKPYLPYFADRNRLAVDLFAVNGQAQNKPAIPWMIETVQAYMRAGFPVYITQDALDCKDRFGGFGISAEEVESVWKPFPLLPVKDFPGTPPNRLYLVCPPAMPERLEEIFRLRLKMHGLLNQWEAVRRTLSRGTG